MHDQYEQIPPVAPIEWLGSNFEVDTKKCVELLDRLVSSGEIDRHYAESFLAAFSCSPTVDARKFVYNLGRDSLLWLMSCSTPLGADHPRVEDLDQYLTSNEDELQ